MTRLKCRCYVCNVDIHNRYYIRHLWSRKHLRNASQNVPPYLQIGDENKLYNLLRMRQIGVV